MKVRSRCYWNMPDRIKILFSTSSSNLVHGMEIKSPVENAEEPYGYSVFLVKQ